MRQSLLPSLWLAFAAGVIAGAPPASPTQVPPSQPVGRSVIVGQVVDADSGRGVPSAVVQVGPLLRVFGPSGFEESLSAYTSGMRFVVADGDGRFVIRNLAKGSYALIIRMNGYVFSSFGQKRPGAPTREIELDGEQRLDDVVILAWKKGVITGVITDEAGAPAVGVSVRALRRTFAGGQARFASVTAGNRTDDRGEYRISGLDPGDYVIAVPSTVVTVPTPIVASYREASASGNAAEAGRLQREAASLGPALTSPAIPSSNGYSMLVAARGRGLMLPQAADAGSVYQTVFHPSVADPGQASVIALRSGEERAGVGLQLKVAGAFQISGRIVLSDGNVGPTQVSLVTSSAEQAIGGPGFETATALTDESGRFHFFGVPEGEYLIKVLRIQRPVTPNTTTSIQAGGRVSTFASVTPDGPSDVSTLPTLWARMPVTVNGNIGDLSVPLAYGARMRGRIEFEGTTAPPTTGRGASINLVPADGRLSSEIPIARAGPDNQFTTAQYPPGRYFVSATPPSGRWWLKSIVYNGADLLRKPLTLSTGEVAGVTITVTDRPTELHGTVRDRNNAVVSDATVALFPADYQTWIADGMTQRVLWSATADKSGAFRFAAVIAGDYLVAAFPATVQRALQDPRFITELATAATRVTLQEGKPATVALTMAAIK